MSAEREHHDPAQNGKEDDGVWVAAPPPPPRELIPTNVYTFIIAFAKQFGFPALIAIALCAYVYKTEGEHSKQMLQQIQDERTDRKEAQAAFIDALAKNTSAVENVSSEVEDTNKKLDEIKVELRRTRTRERED